MSSKQYFVGSVIVPPLGATVATICLLKLLPKEITDKYKNDDGLDGAKIAYEWLRVRKAPRFWSPGRRKEEG